MKCFFSGGPVATIELDKRLQTGTRFRLMSCHSDYVSSAHKQAAALIRAGQPFELMLDSGAYTAWSKGKEVDLDDLLVVYDDMINKYGGWADAIWLISLDKIPGSREKLATAAETDEAMRLSDINFERMQKRYGDVVLPVFHQTEPTSRLTEVAAMSQYVCLSPRQVFGESVRRRWAQHVHTLLGDKRTHGLGATGYRMMTDVPWASVDSASWVMLAANGHVYRDARMRTITVSNQAGNIKDKDCHLRTMPPRFQEEFAALVASKGFAIEALETNFYDRMIFNRVMTTDTVNALPEAAVIAKSVPFEQGLFGL